MITERKIFITSDGQEFDNYTEAYNHNEMIEFAKWATAISMNAKRDQYVRVPIGDNPVAIRLSSDREADAVVRYFREYIGIADEGILHAGDYFYDDRIGEWVEIQDEIKHLQGMLDALNKVEGQPVPEGGGEGSAKK